MSLTLPQIVSNDSQCKTGKFYASKKNVNEKIIDYGGILSAVDNPQY
jgi:hypothetical protein